MPPWIQEQDGIELNKTESQWKILYLPYTGLRIRIKNWNNNRLFTNAPNTFTRRTNRSFCPVDFSSRLLATNSSAIFFIWMSNVARGKNFEIGCVTKTRVGLAPREKGIIPDGPWPYFGFFYTWHVALDHHTCVLLILD